MIAELLLTSFLGFLIGLLGCYLFKLNSFEDILTIVTSYKRTKAILPSLFQVDEESRNHGGQLVGQVLKAHGFDFIFTLCGGHISPILVSCEQLGIRVVDTRHEVTAVFAADAVARLKRSVGVVAVTAGPGLTNTVTAIKNAQMAESPVVLLGGAAATLLKGRGALQDIDQMALFRPLCKFVATIHRVADIGPILTQAIQAAQSGTPGPVFVEFPIDTLYPYGTVKKELGQTPEAKTFRQKLVNLYLEWHICRLFGGAWKQQDFTPLIPQIPMPTDLQIDECVALIRKAERPVLVFGSQAVSPPVDPQTLKKSVEQMEIPTFLGGMCRGLLGRDGRLYIRHQRGVALKEADLIILAGAVCDFRLGYGRSLNRKAKIITINRNRQQLLKNSDMFWKPTVAIQADVATTVVKLSEKLNANNSYVPKVDWFNSLKQRDAEKEKKNREMANAETEAHLNPLSVLFSLEESLPDNAILVADGGDFVGSAAYILRPRGPLQWLDPGAFGTLGVGGGFALGAKLVHPDRPVWVIYGDGSVGYSIVETDTYVRHKVPIVSVVGNDACWSQIAREQLPMFGTSVGCGLTYTNYDKVAESFGAVGMRLDREDQSSIGDRLKKVAQLNGQGQTVLLNVLIGKTNFRQGSISV